MSKRIVYIIILYFFCLVCFTLNAQPVEVDTQNGVFHDRVRTLEVYPEGNRFAPPVVMLGNPNDRIVISFDHLAEDREYLRYEIVHCNAYWQPSGLVDSEFLDGFNVGYIEDYEFSQATTVHYVHYRLVIPNDQIRPLISGNYLVKIYPEDDPEDIWAQCRFMVSEQSALISGEVTSRTDVDYNREHQQLSLIVDTERSDVRDPFNDVIVEVVQNSRADNVSVVTHPLRVMGKKAYYEHLPALIFPAGNEYRRFETVNVYYPTMGVDAIEYQDPYYHFTLATDQSRSGEQYLYDSTQHGRFFVREYNSSHSDTEADYAVVHFSLDYPEIPGMMLFIDGDMVNRRFEPESLMAYNRATGRYERNMLLKQGAYNYQYLAVPSGSTIGKTSVIEGDKYQTVNEYTVYVYNRDPRYRYDRLIGTATIYSGR